MAIDLLESGIRHEPQDEDRYFQAADLCEQAHRDAEARALRQRGTEFRESLGLSALP